MALILRNGGSQSPDRWLKEPRNNQDYFYGLLKRNNKKVNDVIEFYKYVVTNNLDIYNLTSIERKNVDEFVTFMFKAQNNEN